MIPGVNTPVLASGLTGRVVGHPSIGPEKLGDIVLAASER
jgi:hypothetical protein